MDDLNNKIKVVDKLIKQCEQSKLVSFAYKDVMFSISFNKAQAETDNNNKVIQNIDIENVTELMIDNFEIASDEYVITDIGHLDRYENENIITIVSDFVGTVEFSNQIKLVDKDIHINKGDVICTVEAMKLYNDIKAPASGTIVEIIVKDGTLVEYEQPILKIRVDKNE